MKNILLPLFFLINSFVFAQVGIGTAAPDASAILDIKSANAGLLIPRISLTSTSDNTTIVNPATSLLVYNTSSVSDVTPGFYYWESVWKSFKGTSSGMVSGGWALSGNTLATGNEYLGTNNYNSLVFKVNGNQVGKFHPNGGITLGLGASANDNSSVAIGRNASASTSNEAIALGYAANSSGYRSTALGYNSVASNNNTLALGLSSNASGFQATALGVSAVSNTNNSLAIGNSSRATGQQATAIGTESNSSAQNATAIGYQATATQANSIVLGSSTNNNNKVGIGTTTPDERLHINGSIKIVDGTQGSGKVLTSDANGKASWSTFSRISSFSNVYSRNNQTRNYNQNVTFGSTNSALNINVNDDNFQVNTTGTYKITYTVTFYKNNENDAFRFGLFTTNNNNSFISGSITSTGNLEENDTEKNALSITNSVIVTLNALDKIYLRCLSSGSSNNGHKINLLGNGCSLLIEQLN